MPDGFKAEPPRWSPEQPSDSAYDRYAEVSLRKPDKKAGVSGVFLVLAVGLVAILALGLISLLGKSPAFVAVPPPKTGGLRPLSEMKALHGTWVATAVTINGEEVTDGDLAKVNLKMQAQGYVIDLPTNTWQGDRCYWQRSRTKTNLMEINFIIGIETGMSGIYEINGDTLKMCLGQAGGPHEERPRPTDFTAEKGSNRTLLVLKRKEP